MTNENKLDESTLELLDLYACGALEGKERVRVESLISQSKEAQEYIDDANSMFAQFEDNSKSSDQMLRDIKLKIHQSSNDQKVATVTSLDLKRKNFLLPFLAGAVAASILAISIGVVAWPNSSAKQTSAMSEKESMKIFKEQGDTSFVELKDSSGHMGAEVMMHQEGDIMIDGRKLADLDENSTYQLWAVVQTSEGKQVISAGVLGGKPGIFMVNVHGDVKAFAITREAVGGVEKTSKEPVYSAQVA